MRSLARASLSASASASVVVGSVFGISNTAVTPPSTAAREPVSRSSFHSRPGSRKWTWVSITPGSTVRPAASNTSPAEAWARSPIAATLPPRTPTSAGPRPAWFTTSPPRTIRSKVSGMGGLGLLQELVGGRQHRLHRQVHHVAERLGEAGVDGLDLVEGARAAHHPGMLAPRRVEPVVRGSEQADGGDAGRGGQVHGPGV